MQDILRIDGATRGPLAFPDRGVGEVVARNIPDPAAVADSLYLLLEIRRVLAPGGRLTVVPGNVPDSALLHRLSGLAGLESDTGRSYPELPAGAYAFFKRDRMVSGSPLVSIAIPAYSPKYFSDSIASALNQDYENLEILVCDDSSSGAVEDITNQLARNRPVRYVRNPSRLGARSNYAKCFDLANGEFIKFLNDDDILEPYCVERLMGAFRQAPDISLATSYRIRIDHNGTLLPDQPATRPIAPQDVIVRGPTLANVMLMAGLNVIGEPSTVMFRKADLLNGTQDNFTFDGVRGPGVIDMTMWSSLLLKGDAVYLRDALSRFRIHPDQQQADPGVRQRGIEGIRKLQAVWLGLGLHLRYERNQMHARPFPHGDVNNPPPPAPVRPPAPAPKIWRYC